MKTALSDECLREIVQRIIEVAEPERIILFGSAARDEMDEDSDVDLLVVKSGVHRRRLAQAINARMFGVGKAVDVIVVTPEDIETYGDCSAMVIESALREGKVVYREPVHTDTQVTPNAVTEPNVWC